MGTTQVKPRRSAATCTAHSYRRSFSSSAQYLWRVANVTGTARPPGTSSTSVPSLQKPTKALSPNWATKPSSSVMLEGGRWHCSMSMMSLAAL
jgi:hypothetical protein